MEPRLGDSFGAKVKLTFPESNEGQFFWVKSSSPDINLAALTRSHGGRVVLEGRDWVIVELGFNEAMELRKLQGVILVGGVSLDPQRFAAFGKFPGFNLPQT